MQVLGRVIDAHRGEPIPNAKVKVGTFDLHGGYSWVTETHTDEEGSYRFSGTSGQQDQVVILAEAPGYVSHSMEGPLPQRPGSCVRLHPLVLSPGVTVRGRVEFPDGNPASSGQVFLVDSLKESRHGMGGKTSPFPVLIQPDGSFTLAAQGPRFAANLGP